MSALESNLEFLVYETSALTISATGACMVRHTSDKTMSSDVMVWFIANKRPLISAPLSNNNTKNRPAFIHALWIADPSHGPVNRCFSTKD